MDFNSFELVNCLKDKIESNFFDKKIFDLTGLFIMRNVIPEEKIKLWQNEWEKFYQKELENSRKINPNNKVVINEKLPDVLNYMYRDEIFIDTAKLIHGENVALYNHRFVVKDKYNLDEVFLHNDSCYHLGYLNKCSFFTPLSWVGKENGGLTFHLGTHKYGYLGDAGEINPDSFDIKWPKITPELNPGDFVIMHSSLWHESGPNLSKIDRVIVDTHYQPANDPTGKELLSGVWETDFWFSMENPIKYFNNSRLLKIINNKNNK
jgi:ectoine hydroxylase-related dioxygenase (phytanoyl-CoA dioxygenase family)